MAITYVGGATDASFTSGNLVVAENGSPAENDIMLCLCNVIATDGVWTDPADWTQIDQFDTTTGSSAARMYIGYKVRGADAGSGYSFGWSGTEGNAGAMMITYRGGDTSTPFDVTYVKATHFVETSNARNTAAQPITTTTDGAMVVLMQHHSGEAIDTFGPPTNYQQRTAQAGTSINQYSCDRLITSASTETPGVFTHTDAVETQDPRTFTLAIRESGAGASIGRLGGIDNRFNSFIR